jgi:adenylate cyclase
MKDPSKVKLGGEKRDVTVLFTDIAHFTTISEALSPESLVALLNEYLEAMTEEIMAEGGTVDKYEGDAIMAYFGAPLEQNDHYARACRVALAMRKRLDKLRDQWKNAGPLPGGESRPEIDFRCGINTGVAIVGNVGSSKRLEYTVMGDNINLGSRLEGANKNYGTNLMISESTYEKVKDSFEMRELDLIKVVGKTKPIRVFELLNEKGALVPAAQALLKLYNEGLQLYKERRFEEALHKFEEILQAYPQDGPSKLYRQRSEILRNFPPPADWDGVFEMRSK